MSRTTPARVQAAAFDFDVVTDVPARPSRKPETAPEPARAERGGRSPAKTDAPDAR